MGTTKANDLQSNDTHEYLIYDSSVPTVSIGDSVFSRSLPKVNQELLRTAINSVKGAMFSSARCRIYFCPEGYKGNPNDTIRLEYNALFMCGMGAIKNTLVSASSDGRSSHPYPDF